MYVSTQPSSLPKLSLYAKLSQSYLNKATLALIFSFWTLYMIASLIEKDGILAKKDMASSCTGLEVATNALASTPYYIAKGLNRQMTVAIQTAERNAVEVVTFSLKLLEQLLLFVLFRYQKVIQCIVFLSVTSTLKAVSQYASEITNFINSELGVISGALSAGLDGINNSLKSINDATSHIPFNPVPQIPLPITIPGISNNLRWTLPNGTTNSLQALQTGTLSLGDVKSTLSNLISQPFNLLITTVTQDIQGAIDKTNLTDPHAFDFLPLPSKVDSIHFCQGIVPLAAVDRIVESSLVGVWLGLFIVCFAILCTFVFYAFVTWYHHHLYEKDYQAVLMKVESHEENSTEATRYIELVFHHPVLRRLINFIPEGRLKKRLIWLCVYTSNPTAWLCIGLGLVGLITIRLQLILIPFIARKVYPLFEHEITATAEAITKDVGQAIGTSVGPYVDAMNKGLQGVEEKINNVMLGFIDQTLGRIEQGIDSIFSSFKDELHSITKIFGPLDDAATSFFTCVVGDVAKTIKEIEAVLGNNTGVHLGRVSAAQFSLDTTSLLDSVSLGTSLTKLGSEASTGFANSIFQRQLELLIDRYQQTIAFQSIPFIIILCYGLSLIVFGIIGCLFV